MKHFTKCLKFLLLTLCVVGGAGSAWADTTTELYTFTSKSWTATLEGNDANWTSGKDGAGFSNNGVQVTTNANGANATSPKSFDNISKIVVTYNTNKAKGAGSFDVQIGENDSKNQSWAYSSGDGTSANYTLQYDYDTPQSGAVKFTANTTTNSIYVVSIAITYETGGGDTPAATLSYIALSGTYPTTFNEGDAFSHEGMIVTATYDDESTKIVTSSAIFSGYDMSTPGTQTVTVSYTENGEVKTASYDITVNAIPSHTVTWSVNGATTSDTFKEGADITFPNNPANVEGKSFYGWTTEALVGVTDEAPETVSSATMGNADVTYYAVFADRVAGDQITATDVLTRETTAVTGTSYESWSEKAVATSDAVYAGQSAGGNNSIQLRSNNSNSGVISTTSGGKISKVVVEWAPQTEATRTLDIYGSNAAYTVASDLYSSSTQGTKLGSVVKNTAATNDGDPETDELTIDGDYTYIGFRSASGALYLSSVSITWTSSTPDTYSGFCTTVAADIREEAGISFAEATVTKEIVVGYTGQALTNPNSLSVIWTSSDESVATVENGTVTVLAVGETTITATFAGNEDYKAGTASYTLTVQDSREAIELSFAAASVDVNVDESVDAPALNGNTGNGAVTYTSSDEAIATVNPSTGEVTGVADGTATITATVAATNEYQGGTATFTVNVIDPNKKGTANNPYTVAEALDATPASGNSETVYVSGIVSRFYNTDIVTDNSHRYYISDDGTTETDELMVYNGKGLNNVAFSSADDLQIGDKVVIVGQLTTYSSTKEFAKDNYIYSRITKADNTITVTGGTEFTINRENNEEELTLSATATSEEDVIFTVDTENTTIAADNYDFEDGLLLVSGTKGGVIVIKANAAGNESYKDAEEVTITVTVIGVKDDATILVENSEVAYGQTFTVDAELIEGGDITLTSSNTAVATVDGLVITPVAVGTTTIIVATAEDETYKAGSKTFTLTVTAPAGQTTAPSAEAEVVFAETFAASTGSITTFSNSDGNGTFTADNTWTVENSYGAGGAAKFGSGKKAGSATTPAISATVGTVYTLSFKAAPWASESSTMSVSVEGGNIEGISEDAMTTGEWNDFTATITATDESFTITFTASNNRFFLDEVEVVKPASEYIASVTFNAYGYATFCSPYPLDFTNAPGVDAYFVSEVNGTQVNFKNFDAPVKGGTPLFLVGEPGSTVTIPSVDSENEPDVNQLVGTLAPTYVETENGAYTNFGLSGENFVKIKGGVVKAGKAYLPILTETLSAQEGAKLRLVFTDSATGIATVKEVPAAALDGILYNMSGQRVSASYKGIVIKDGKKYLNK